MRTSSRSHDPRRGARHLSVAGLFAMVVASCGAVSDGEATDARAADPPVLVSGDVEVVLELPPERGDGMIDGLHDVRVRLVNRSEDTIRLVLPGDGSDMGWRTPLIGWSVLPADADAEHPPEPTRRTGRSCGNINPIRASEVVELAPGESVTAGGYFLRPMLPRGTHRVAFHYRNDPSIAVGGIPLGLHDPGAIERMRASTRCEAWSDEILVTRR